MVKTAGSEAAPKRPKHWPNMVRAAVIRQMDGTQEEAAEAAGRSVRTIRDWEGGDIWPDALREAESHWLVNLKRASMRSVLKGAGRNPDMGLKILERMMPQLAPPKQKHELSGPNGGPIPVESRLSQVPDDELFRGREAAAAKAIGA